MGAKAEPWDQVLYGLTGAVELKSGTHSAKFIPSPYQVLSIPATLAGVCKCTLLCTLILGGSILDSAGFVGPLTYHGSNYDCFHLTVRKHTFSRNRTLNPDPSGLLIGTLVFSPDARPNGTSLGFRSTR